MMVDAGLVMVLAPDRTTTRRTIREGAPIATVSGEFTVTRFAGTGLCSMARGNSVCGGDRRKYEHGNLAGRLLLVVRVIGVGGHRPLPPDSHFLAGHFTCGVVAPVAAVLEFHMRV